MMKFAVGFKLQYSEYRLFVVVKEASVKKEGSLITIWNITTSLLYPHQPPNHANRVATVCVLLTIIMCLCRFVSFLSSCIKRVYNWILREPLYGSLGRAYNHATRRLGEAYHLLELGHLTPTFPVDGRNWSVIACLRGRDFDSVSDKPARQGLVSLGSNLLQIWDGEKERPYRRTQKNQNDIQKWNIIS